jgi:hypothetical protein
MSGISFLVEIAAGDVHERTARMIDRNRVGWQDKTASAEALRR